MFASINLVTAKGTTGPVGQTMRTVWLDVLSPGHFEIGRHPPARRLLMADCLQAPASRGKLQPSESLVASLQYTSLSQKGS